MIGVVVVEVEVSDPAARGRSARLGVVRIAGALAMRCEDVTNCRLVHILSALILPTVIKCFDQVQKR